MKYFPTDHKLEEINLRMHQARRLKELHLSKGVLNSEALMLVLNKKYKSSDGKRMLFKYLDAQDDEEVMRRKETVLSYLNQSSYKELEELIIPEYLVKVDSKPAGFAMPLIENHKNLGIILQSEKVPFQTKKEYLIELGNLLDKVWRIEDPHRIVFGDLNEFNFIVDKDNHLKAVDLDSSFVEGVEGLEPSTYAYYLLRNPFLKKVKEKYQTTDIGFIRPNYNSDFYSYCMIILRTLSTIPMHTEKMETYYSYLDYLKELGVPQELIEIFFHLYTPKHTANPKDFIEEIPDDILTKSTIVEFQKKYPF